MIRLFKTFNREANNNFFNVLVRVDIIFRENVEEMAR